ncbi:MAG TPA: adenosylcobinamide-GDP ribazoletransferase [Desulfomonilaceae bacterium]|nr:adenosylcobinamide-GDP ribazoletransferase [Desulfomonilaceae bacterium]
MWFMVRSIQIAIGFLTVFRTHLEPYPDMTEVGRSAWAFPLVGALIGGILVGVDAMLAPRMPPVLASVLVVSTWIVLTGALHLDGWTDCWDALPTAVSPERRFEIMKDSRLGTFGAVALITILAVKASAVAGPGISLTELFLAPVIGRGTMVLAARGSRHRGDGMAALFLNGVDGEALRWTFILGVIPAILAGWSGVFGAAAAYGGAVWFRRFAESRLPCVNGDVLGGMCECSEAVFLIVASVTW